MSEDIVRFNPAPQLSRGEDMNGWEWDRVDEGASSLRSSLPAVARAAGQISVRLQALEREQWHREFFEREWNIPFGD